MHSTGIRTLAQRARLRLTLFTALLVAVPLVAVGVSAGPAEAQNGVVSSVDLTLLGSSDLAVMGLDGEVKPRGQNGDVAVLGDTAFVGGGSLFHGANNTSGRICTDYGGVKVVDISDPSDPTVTTTIDIEDTLGAEQRGGVELDNVSVSAGAVDARYIDTDTFTGDLLAIATQRCEPSFFGGARVEFWDVTDPASPVKIGEFDPANVTYTDPETGEERNGTWGIFEDVRIVEHDGKVLALATTPFSIGNAHDATPFGDFRVIDITDVTDPQQIDVFPPVSLGQDSVNGCRTFLAGRSVAPGPDNGNAYLSFYDGSNLFGADTAAVFELDLDNIPEYVEGTEPPEFNPDPPHWGYPPNPMVEGNAADLEPFTGPDDGTVVIVSEDDIDAANSELTLTAPDFAAGTFHACQNPVGAHLYEIPGQEISATVAYVGRGCPATSPEFDEYLEDPDGKIALLDSGGNNFQGCSFREKIRRAADAGAVAVMLNGGGEAINSGNNGPEGGLPEVPALVVTGSAYEQMQYVPTPNLLAGAYEFPSDEGGCNGCGWGRSSDNVTVVPWTAWETNGASFTPQAHTTSKGQFRSVPSAGDRQATGAVEDRFEVEPGAEYEAGAFLEVEATETVEETGTVGAFGASVVWYDETGTVISEDEIASLNEPTARARYEQTVTAPAGAATASVRFGWTGENAQGIGYAYGFEFVPADLQATLADREGEWGAQRFIDFSQSPPTEIGAYRSPTSTQWPPPDNGIYAPRLARTVNGQLAFTTWLSDGLRVLDVSDPSDPREVGSYVPPAVDDPAPEAGAGDGLTRGQVWPDATLVTGVEVIPDGTDGTSAQQNGSSDSGLVVLSDINAGLYVLSYEVQYAEACPPDEVPEDGFTDVPQDNVHEANIDCIAWYEITSGKTATTYDPSGNVTRGQMASFIVRTIENATGGDMPAGDDQFTDDDGSTHEDAINKLANAGIAQGKSANSFAPEDPVSRAQMAAFLVRAYEHLADTTLESSQDYFDDDDDSTHEDAINAAREAGFTQGKTATTYDPSGDVRRDQMGSFLARFLQRLVEDGLAQAKS